LQRRPFALALSLILLSACQAPPFGAHAPVATEALTAGNSQKVGPITGKAHFPESWLQALPGEVTTRAMVTLIDPLDGITLSAGRTDATGTFSLTPSGNLSLPVNSYYYLEVSKRPNGNAIGSDVVAMRTVLKWTATGWASITNGTGGSGELVVNPTTTAMTLLDHEDAAIAFSDLIGKVFGPPSYTTVMAFGNHTATSVAARAEEVSARLAANEDPLGGIRERPGNLAPGDLGDAAVHHDFVKTVKGVPSVFVWIPSFTAYQLLQPQGGYPVGYWVKDRPAGTEDVDWAKERFGGFYVGKYEASRADATGAAVGVATSLKVGKGLVPWTDLTWDQASLACRSYDPNAYLMRDDEWTALAVWSMTRNPDPVFGNNALGGDMDRASITFTADPTQGGSGRVLTGSGADASWTGDKNLTTHTGKTDGVYDLNGNLLEWTSSLEATNGVFMLDEIKLGINVPALNIAYVTGLSTDPLLRRYGVPTSLAMAPAPGFGTDAAFYAPIGSYRAVRGGSWYEGSLAGMWLLALVVTRSTTHASLGFRPAMRY